MLHNMISARRTGEYEKQLRDEAIDICPDGLGSRFQAAEQIAIIVQSFRPL